MGKAVEIPEELYEALTERAAREGVSLVELVSRELTIVEENERAKDALLDRIRHRPPVALGISAAELIREGREEREQQLTERWSSSTPRH